MFYKLYLLLYFNVFEWDYLQNILLVYIFNKLYIF